MPEGSVPLDTESEGVGEPFVVTEKLNTLPAVDVAEFVLVIVGAGYVNAIGVEAPIALLTVIGADPVEFGTVTVSVCGLVVRLEDVIVAAVEPNETVEFAKSVPVIVTDVPGVALFDELLVGCGQRSPVATGMPRPVAAFQPLAAV